METATVTPNGTQVPSPTAWIDAYVAWASKRSPLTPSHFHEGIAYTLAACAIAGRLCVQTPQGRIYPNLYTLLLGKTSVYAKSVSMDLSQELADVANISNRVINSVFTPESIVGELSGEKPANLAQLTPDLQVRWRDSADWKACRMFRLDEAGLFFNGLKRDYNAGMQDLWMKLYDCPATVERTTYKHGLHVIQQPVLSCLFATTPASIGPLLRDQSMWLQGFWPRWNFCVGSGFTEFVRSEMAPITDAIRKPLFVLGNQTLAVHKAESPLVVPVDPAVLADYESALDANRKRTYENADGYMEAVLGRLHTKRMKLAMILASLAQPDDKKIAVTPEFWDATARPVRQMESDMAEALQQSRSTEKATIEERIAKQAKAQGNKITLREIQRLTGMACSEITPLMDPLEKCGVYSMDRNGRTVTYTLHPVEVV